MGKGKDKDKVIKLNFQLTNVSQYYRWYMEMPIVLSKCKLTPRTLKMANAQFTTFLMTVLQNFGRREACVY